MGGASGQSSAAHLLTTREVRWFHNGAVPQFVLDWFTSAGPVDAETRIDRYDLSATQRGIGIKYRDGGTLDTKRRLRVQHAVLLAPGLEGHVEDWAKYSETSPAAAFRPDADYVEVTKEILTRKYYLTAADGANGCEAELASVRMGWVPAWSLCFETFGSTELRKDAFTLGVARFLEDSPLPEGLRFGPESSKSYPDWLRSLSAKSA